MRVEVHLHAELARLAPEQRGVVSLEVPDGTRVADVLQRFALQEPPAAHHRRRQLKAIAVRGSVKGLEIAKRLHEPLLKGPLSYKRLAEAEVYRPASELRVCHPPCSAQKLANVTTSERQPLTAPAARPRIR